MAMAAGLWWSSVAAAAATSNATGSGTDAASAEAALRVQAQELADQIQSEGIVLNQLAEHYDATQLRSQQLAVRLQVLGVAMARTDAEVTTARTTLKEQV